MLMKLLRQANWSYDPQRLLPCCDGAAAFAQQLTLAGSEAAASAAAARSDMNHATVDTKLLAPAIGARLACPLGAQLAWVADRGRQRNGEVL